MTAAPISEYSMMKGNRYGAESCTILPMMLTRPQLKKSLELGSRAVVKLLWKNRACACGASTMVVAFKPMILEAVSSNEEGSSATASNKNSKWQNVVTKIAFG